MKANELMIGDWVFCEGQPIPSNVTIQSIAEDGVWFMGDKVEGAATFDRIFPIPLTLEILEKNGFGEYEYNEVYGDEIEVEVSLYEWPIDEGSCPGFSTHLHYVHELQHALRLCGIEKEITI